MDDTISRREALDALWKALFKYEDETEQKFQASGELDDWFMHRIFVQNISDIDRQTLLDLPSAQPEQQWIPVVEGLPKAGERVGNVEKYYLVQNEYGDMLVARYTHSGYWEQIYQLNPIDDKIVAWMPLPEPYKRDEEKDETD